MSTRSIGNWAEEKAGCYLETLGYQILEKNYQIRGGEIDLVAKDQDTLVFIEVKARWSHEYGEPFESISPLKIRNLLKTAEVYTNKINWGEKPYRIDAISLDFTQDRDNPKIELIKSITS